MIPTASPALSVQITVPPAAIISMLLLDKIKKPRSLDLQIPVDNVFEGGRVWESKFKDLDRDRAIPVFTGVGDGVARSRSTTRWSDGIM